MEKEKKKINKTFFRVLETLLDIVILALAIRLLVSSEAVDNDTFLAVFAVAGCAYLITTINKGSKPKLRFVKNLVITVTYFVIALVLIIVDDFAIAINAATILYFLTVVFSRILAIIRKHKVFGTIVNVVLILGVGLMIFAIISSEEWYPGYSAMILGITVPFQMLVRVTILSFSHIRYDILSKVIRKSMAVEILTGLLILIVSFSFVFTAIQEQGIESYGDALWYCFAIVTTIGFGDIYAVSILGRVLSVILGIYGIIVVSLITSIIVNFYSELNKEPEPAGIPGEGHDTEPDPEEKDDLL